MSLFDWVRFVAVFVDSKGNTVGSKVFAHTFGFRGLTKTTFDYMDGTYNINPKAFKVQFSVKTHIFFDTDIFVYQIDHPDPLEFNEDHKVNPVMSAEVYRVRLKNKLVVDLNKIAMGGPDVMTILKWLALAGVVFLVVYYFMNGGSLSSAPTPEPATAVANASAIIRPTVGRVV